MGNRHGSGGTKLPKERRKRKYLLHTRGNLMLDIVVSIVIFGVVLACGIIAVGKAVKHFDTGSPSGGGKKGTAPKKEAE